MLRLTHKSVPRPTKSATHAEGMVCAQGFSRGTIQDMASATTRNVSARQWCGVVAVIGVLALLVGCSDPKGGSGLGEPTIPSVTKPATESAGEECLDAICLAEEARTVWEKEGVEAAVRFLEGRSATMDDASAVCHDGLHRLGSTVAKRGGDPHLGSSALVACSGGFFHGLFAAYGTEPDWTARMVDTCRGFVDAEALLCKHGYGHGAVAGVVDGQLEVGLQRCETLVEADGSGVVEGVSLHELCGDGLFMEVVSFVEAGEWDRVDPVQTCSALRGWQAWGCWRQMGRLTEREGVLRYARACNTLDAYLSEGCAVGVAEASVALGAGDLEACDLLLTGRELCTSRLDGRR
jgi:hypothetical protein